MPMLRASASGRNVTLSSPSVRLLPALPSSVVSEAYEIDGMGIHALQKQALGPCMYHFL